MINNKEKNKVSIRDFLVIKDENGKEIRTSDTSKKKA